MEQSENKPKEILVNAPLEPLDTESLEPFACEPLGQLGGKPVEQFGKPLEPLDLLISNSLEEARRVLDAFIRPENIALIDEAATLIAGVLQTGGKVLSCGNGGSLCDATHFAEELTGRYRNDRKPYPAIAINDPAYITCVGNDYAFDEIFSRYVEAVGKAGDVLLAISTSGTSANVVRAAQAAKAVGMKVIALTREGTSPLSGLSDIVLASPHATYSDRVQEIHIKIIHILIQAIEMRLGHS